MDVSALDTLTDSLAKTDSSSFPLTEKLSYYNMAYGILYGLIIDAGEDNYEEEDTKSTVAGQREYKQKARIHHINWLKIDYGSGFVPARYRSYASLFSEYGNDLETELTQWDSSYPIYWYSGQHFFIAPTPSASQAGSGRLKASMELLPTDLDRSSNTTPLLPENFHYLLSVYAAYMRHDIDSEDSQAQKRKTQFDEGARLMLETMFPRARQQEFLSGVPDENGSNY
jgi:hypothetical protein